MYWAPLTAERCTTQSWHFQRLRQLHCWPVTLRDQHFQSLLVQLLENHKLEALRNYSRDSETNNKSRNQQTWREDTLPWWITIHKGENCWNDENDSSRKRLNGAIYLSSYIMIAVSLVDLLITTVRFIIALVARLPITITPPTPPHKFQIAISYLVKL